MNRFFATILAFLFAFCSCAEELSQSANSFTPIHEASSFPGGVSARTQFLSLNIQYPQECVINGVEGVVMVKYRVKTDGSLDDFKVVTSSGNELLDEEALRVVKMFPNHTPSKLRGEAVDSYLTLPVSFRMK